MIRESMIKGKRADKFLLQNEAIVNEPRTEETECGDGDNREILESESKYCDRYGSMPFS